MSARNRPLATGWRLWERNRWPVPDTDPQVLAERARYCANWREGHAAEFEAAVARKVEK